MFYADQHMHSNISFDSDAPRTEMAEAAVRAGLSALCFTDHYDVVDEFGNLHPAYDWEPARKAQAAARAAWGEQITLGFGVELGNAPADFAAAEGVLREPGLDLVIGSIHNGSEAVGSPDYYNVRYDTPELCRAHLADYFRSMLRLARWGQFDVLGHIPYPLRYMRDRDGQPVGLEPFREEIREILRCTIQAGRGIEVNTCQFHPGTAGDYGRVLEDYRELGGEIVTVGADAHDPAHVGEAVAEGHALLRSRGFRYAAHYVGREPRFYSLEEVESRA